MLTDGNSVIHKREVYAPQLKSWPARTRRGTTDQTYNLCLAIVASSAHSFFPVCGFLHFQASFHLHAQWKCRRKLAWNARNHIQSCAEKRDCFAKHQPGVAGCGWLQPGRNFLSTKLHFFCSTLYREERMIWICYYCRAQILCLPHSVITRDPVPPQPSSPPARPRPEKPTAIFSAVATTVQSKLQISPIYVGTN